MAIYSHLDYVTEVEDPDVIDSVLELYVRKTNADKNGVHFDYVVSEVEDHYHVDEISNGGSRINGRRSVVNPEKELVIEGVLERDIAADIKEEYDRLKDDSPRTLH